ncbi:MAG: hypothetical protein ACLGIR_13795 [Actinomycetes bacterium]
MSAGGRAARTPLPWREVALAAAVSLVLAVATSWPLAARLGQVLPGDLGDPLLQTWQLTWAGHALADPDATVRATNAWWPLDDTTAFSDPPLGWAPLFVGVVPTRGLTDADAQAAALTRYGVAFLLALATAWLGPYLLARSLRVGPWAAAVAAGAVAYAPWRLAHDGHLNILSTGGAFLAAALVVAGVRRRRPGLLVAAGVALAWQVACSAALAVPVLYAATAVALAAGGVLLVRRHRTGERPDVPPALLAGAAAGAAIAGVATAWRALPYLAVTAAHPEAARTVGVLDVYSPPVAGLLAAPASSLVWGRATGPLREGMAWAPEMTLLPGLTVLVLAAIGLVRGRLGGDAVDRPLRIGLAVAAVVAAVLSLGTTPAGGRLTYLPLFEALPGLDGLRTPGRLVLLTSAALALLAAAGAAHVLARVADRRGRRAAHAAGALLAGLVLLEGLGTTELVVPPPAPAAALALPGPVLHLPSAENEDSVPLLWTVPAGLPDTVNGTGSFEPDLLAEVRERTTAWPDPGAVAYLRDLGVASVVWHAGRAGGTPVAEAGVRATDPATLARLGLTRTVHRDPTAGDVVVWRLDPDPRPRPDPGPTP